MKYFIIYYEKKSVYTIQHESGAIFLFDTLNAAERFAREQCGLHPYAIRSVNIDQIAIDGTL